MQARCPHRAIRSRRAPRGGKQEIHYAEYLKGHHSIAHDMSREGFPYRDEEEFLMVLAERQNAEDDPAGAGHAAEERIRLVLGEDRYSEYRRSGRAEFRELRLLTRRFGLQDGVASSRLRPESDRALSAVRAVCRRPRMAR